DGPILGVTRIHFKEARTPVSPTLAVGNVPDGEGLVLSAHVVRAGPFTTAVVVYRVNVDEAARYGSLEESFAGLGSDVPPALGGPALGVLVTDGDTDTALRGIAQLEVRMCRLRHE